MIVGLYGMNVKSYLAVCLRFVKGCHHGERTVERQAITTKRGVTAVQISANSDAPMGTITKAVQLSWAAPKDVQNVHRMQIVPIQHSPMLNVTQDIILCPKVIR